MCQVRVGTQCYQRLFRQVDGVTQFFTVNLDLDFADTLLDLLADLQLLLLGLGFPAKSLKL